MNKTPQQQDAQFSSPLPRYSYQDDTISLVNLTKTLVKRWRLMAIVLVTVILIAFIYALVLPTQYEFTTIYNSAEVSPGSPLEPTESSQSKVNSIYLPQQTRALLKNEGLDVLPFTVAVSIPQNTNLITLTSKAQETDIALVTQLHHAIIAQLKREQDLQAEQRIATLQKQLDAGKQQLEFILDKDSNKSGEIAASLMASVSNLESQISNFAPGIVVEEVSQSLQPKGISKKVVMLLAVALGGVLALIAVFVRELASQVCLGLRADS